jgi:hypothetical protein
MVAAKLVKNTLINPTCDNNFLCIKSQHFTYKCSFHNWDWWRNERFAIVLQIISCGQETENRAFNVCALETKKLVVEKYPWFYLSDSTHKICICETQIISSAMLWLDSYLRKLGIRIWRDFRNITQEGPLVTTQEQIYWLSYRLHSGMDEVCGSASTNGEAWGVCTSQ